MPDSPIQVELFGHKPQFLVEEGVRLDVKFTAPAGLLLEPVALNKTKTRILVQGDDKTRLSLNGLDYFRLHHVNLLIDVGKPIKTPAFPVTSRFDLMNFTRPLAPGHYRLLLTYRDDAAGIAEVRSNIVEFDVRPGHVVSQKYRWLAGRYRREALGSIWTAKGGEGKPDGWYFQVTDRRDPGVIFSAIPLEMGETARTGPPVLAHITGPAAARMFHMAVWPTADGCGWVRFNPRGLAGEPATAAHGLQPGAMLLDPPLQRRNGGLAAVFAGLDQSNQPTVSYLEVDGKDRPSIQHFPWQGDSVPDEAVAVWSSGEAPLTCRVFALESQKRVSMQPLGGVYEILRQEEEGAVLRFLRCDQQSGRGKVLVLRDDRVAYSRSVLGWDLERTEAGALPIDSYIFEHRPEQSLEIADAAAHDEGAGMTLLYRLPGGEYFAGPISVAGDGAYRAPAGAPPELVVTPRNGAYLVSIGSNGRAVHPARIPAGT